MILPMVDNKCTISKQYNNIQTKRRLWLKGRRSDIKAILDDVPFASVASIVHFITGWQPAKALNSSDSL